MQRSFEVYKETSFNIWCSFPCLNSRLTPRSNKKNPFKNLLCVRKSLLDKPGIDKDGTGIILELPGLAGQIPGVGHTTGGRRWLAHWYRDCVIPAIDALRQGQPRSGHRGSRLKQASQLPQVPEVLQLLARLLQPPRPSQWSQWSQWSW